MTLTFELKCWENFNLVEIDIEKCVLDSNILAVYDENFKTAFSLLQYQFNVYSLKKDLIFLHSIF